MTFTYLSMVTYWYDVAKNRRQRASRVLPLYPWDVCVPLRHLTFRLPMPSSFRGDNDEDCCVSNRVDDSVSLAGAMQALPVPHGAMREIHIYNTGILPGYNWDICHYIYLH